VWSTPFPDYICSHFQSTIGNTINVQKKLAEVQYGVHHEVKLTPSKVRSDPIWHSLADQTSFFEMSILIIS